MDIRLKKIFSELHALSRFYMIDPPYMVGGVVRDQIIYGSAKVGKGAMSDLDITTNDSDSLRLAILFASRNNFTFRIFDDRHVTVFCDNFNLDFSSNFISKNAVDFLKSEQCTEFLCPAFPDIKDKVLEVYSRDFTINALHQNIITGEIVDILGRSMDDVNNKVIRTILPPEITIMDDPRRIFRAVKFASKFGFKIDENIKKFVKENKTDISWDLVKEGYVSSQIALAMSHNPKLTVDYLREMDILGTIPMKGAFKNFIIDNKLVIEYLDSPKMWEASQRAGKHKV